MTLQLPPGFISIIDFGTLIRVLINVKELKLRLREKSRGGVGGYFLATHLCDEDLRNSRVGNFKCHQACLVSLLFSINIVSIS